MKLYNAVKQLILEKSLEQIINSVRNKNIVTIYYDGEDNGGKGLRVIEPFCFGVSKAGNSVIRAWEREGASFTAQKGEQPLPGWRLFRVDRMTCQNYLIGFEQKDFGSVEILALINSAYKKTANFNTKQFEDNPGLKIKQKQHILVAVDTSGSVSNDELKEF